MRYIAHPAEQSAAATSNKADSTASQPFLSPLIMVLKGSLSRYLKEASPAHLWLQGLAPDSPLLALFPNFCPVMQL